MRKLDSKWLFVGGIMIFAIVTTAIINYLSVDRTSNKIIGAIDTDNGDLEINWNNYPTTDVDLTDSLAITTSGTYHLTGTLYDGSITINAGDGVVKLVLDGTSITNVTGPAIACYSADDLVIELVGSNYLEDGTGYSADYDEDVTGAIYSKADLTFQGTGSLTLIANNQDGIVSKDDLKFNDGNYRITTADDGIRGKDSVYILGGSFAIDSNADAIKSTNETDAGKGFVMIENGNFDITAGAKGIKAINHILIKAGDFAIESYDDAIHSNNYIGITDGNITIGSGDDGIHADRELIVDGGKIDISKSYEGLEAQVITINGGEISVASSDDGLNAGGGADKSAGNRPGANAFDADLDCSISVNAGDIYIDAAGDGIDSNGYLNFNGGTVTIDGPTTNGNGALDAGAGIVMSDGTVVAVGASGMAENLGADSPVYSASIYFSSTQPAGTTIEIKNSAGNIIIEHASAKTFSHVAVGTTAFKSGETYTVYVNNEKYESFTISDTVTTVGNNGMRGGAPQMPPSDRQ